jgi:hypothetical protein
VGASSPFFQGHEGRPDSTVSTLKYAGAPPGAACRVLAINSTEDEAS